MDFIVLKDIKKDGYYIFTAIFTNNFIKAQYYIATLASSINKISNYIKDFIYI
jgi:hypothetical protein